MVLKISTDFNRVFVWYDNREIKSYSTKLTALRAIERRYSISYNEANRIYKEKIGLGEATTTIDNELSYLKERINKLEKKKVSIHSAKKRRLFKKIGKDFEKYRDACGVDNIRYFIHKRKDGALVKHSHLYKYCGLSIDRITTGTEYIANLKEALENLEKVDLENAKKIIKTKTIEEINEDSIGWVVFITHLYQLLCVDDEEIKTKEILSNEI